MKNDRESIGLLLAMFLLLPCLLTIFIQGRQACPARKEISIEEYLPAVTASQIPWDYSREAIQAQTVLARNQLYISKTNGTEKELVKEAAAFLKKKKLDGKDLETFQVFLEAAKKTKGEILKLGEEVKELPYHALSQGKTRDGAEVLGEEFSYLPSADTSKDIDSPLYVEGCYFTGKELGDKIRKRYSGFVMDEGNTVEIKSADSAGYVLEIQIGSQSFQGEEVRDLLGLPSSCFTIQKLGEEIRFLCKGRGHGMGMSQYTAQQLALEGKNYREILQYFFPDLELGK